MVDCVVNGCSCCYLRVSVVLDLIVAELVLGIAVIIVRRLIFWVCVFVFC